MFSNRKKLITGLLCALLAISSCNIPVVLKKTEKRSVPEAYGGSNNADTLNSGAVNWKEFFTDPYLQALIDTALRNNQELNIVMQEIAISRNEIKARKGEYLPFVGLRAGAEAVKAARYTNIGAMEATTEIAPGEEMPEPLPDYRLMAVAQWELDIWHKLRNAKKAAVSRYLASVEGKNFVVTNLVAEIANSYYELLALDNELSIIQQNIELQNNALQIVNMQKQAARVTELAVRRFEAQVLATRSLQYKINQQITETENRINFLLGRFPQHIPRSTENFTEQAPPKIYAGLPLQLLENRPDVRRAENALAAAKFDIQVAKAKFYPSLGISASVGYQAFNFKYFFKSPESLLFSVAGDLVQPLINRNAIKAEYNTANNKQIQAVYDYERTVLNAYMEASNQLAKINNLEKSFELKEQQVAALTKSVDISNNLFRSARADYMEVLLTQRDALESKFELVEIRMQQMNAMVNTYRALGGGWTK